MTHITVDEAYNLALDRFDSHNPHLESVIDRLLPVFTLVAGTAEVWTRDELRQEVIGLITVIREVRSDTEKWGEWERNRFAIFGRLAVTQGDPDENFDIYVRAGTVYGTRVWGDELRKQKGKSGGS